MKVLITGGFGFLGGRLGQFLAWQGGYEVVLGSRMLGREAAWLPEATVVETRWESSSSLDHACAGVDAVVHLAGLNAQRCSADPAAALLVNGAHTAALVASAHRQAVRRFVYLSTVHVYGSPLRGTIDESARPNPRHPYASSHLAGEDVVRAAAERGETEGIVVRLSNSYGVPAHADVDCWTLLVNDLCRQNAAVGRLVLRSSGFQRRDFIPMVDVCAAIKHLLRVPAAELGDGVFNVGGAWAPTTGELAELIQERCKSLFGTTPPLARAPSTGGEVSDAFEFGVSKLRSTGFRATSDRTGEIDGLLRYCVAEFAAR